MYALRGEGSVGRIRAFGSDHRDADSTVANGSKMLIQGPV